MDRFNSAVPENADAFQVKLNERGKLLGKNVIRITFHDKDGDYIDHFSLFLKANAQAEFIKARRELNPGERFQKEDLNTELLELYNIPNSAVTEITKNFG